MPAKPDERGMNAISFAGRFHCHVDSLSTLPVLA